ncbi:hypothetical protein Sango_3071100 [Sesamum angolense]|uniref:MULE transposase domain-containing protein n=1 Tax=Sesamum angolense TaxID=2727404 RepID=A0AAE1TA86_9LAMI|nr:hypothetical protein Sango_3071100 [Sesamum angolense]
MLRIHRGLDVPIVIYVEDEDGEPLQAVDSQGNLIVRPQEDEIMGLLEGINFEVFRNGNENEMEGFECERNGEGQVSKGFEGFEHEGECDRHDCEGQGLGEQGEDGEGQGVEGQGHGVIGIETVTKRMNERMSETLNENVLESETVTEMNENVHESVNETVTENVLEMNETVTEKLSENVPEMNETQTETVIEKLSENVPEMNENLGRDKGKRKLYERFLNESSSEFDDSSDEDYVQSNSETDSDTQSLVLEDVEAESDDDIFLNKNPSKRDLIKKLKRVMKDKNKTVMTEQMPEIGDGDWASDIGDEEDLASLPGSDDDSVDKHPVYKESTTIKDLNLVVGMKFKDAAEYRDGNDNMFPIAMAVVQSENRETWSWFVGELLDDIGGLGTSKWSFISDRQKGLIEALKDLVPDSEHRFCIRHMYQNFKLKFKSEELKEYFWKAASTANRKDFEKYMKKIEEINPKISDDVETASDWLKKISPEHWARSFFPVHSKCDILVNNLCESFNNYILEARDKPIISMFEWIRTKLMSRLQQKRDGMEKYSGSICPNVIKR